jgi:hypothetical protein
MSNTNITSSVLRRTTFRWVGSKWRIMPQLIPLARLARSVCEMSASAEVGRRQSSISRQLDGAFLR